MTDHNSKSSLRRGVLVDCNHDRDARRDETVVVGKQAEKQKSQKSKMSYKSHNQQNNVVHKCSNMFTAQSSSSTTFEQYRHGIAAHMLVEHATLTRYMQALLECNALRGHIVYHPTNVSLATTPEWTCRAVSDTRHALGTKRTRSGDET